MKNVILKSLAVALMFAALPVVAEVTPPSGTIHLVSGGETEGTSIRWLTGKYQVQTKMGRTTVDPEDVASLDIKRPKELDKAIKEQDATLLKEISDTYNNLQHDIEAATHLCEIYLEKEQYKEVADLVKGKVRNDETLVYQGALAPRYWKALIGLDDTRTLEDCLKKALDSDDNEAIASAYVARGNLAMNRTQGSHAENCKAALINGYLRVILLYPYAGSEAYAEALYKGGLAFSGLKRDATKNELYKTLRTTFKNSKWAKLAK